MSDLIEILARLDQFDERLKSLEASVINKALPAASINAGKQKTFAEIIKGKKFNSGQEKITAVIGYYEKITKKVPVKAADVEVGWRDGKVEGKFNPNLLRRAIKDGFVRELGNGEFDLSQSGENFFEKLTKKTENE